MEQDVIRLGLEERVVRAAVELALAEDIGPGDATTRAVVPEGLTAHGQLLAKAHGVLAGLPVAVRTFAAVDPAVRVEPRIADGAALAPGVVIADLHGRARSLLTAERVALNFLQRLSGVATATAALVRAVEGTGAAIVDTRKTTPGLRALEKYAVRVGGGRNHRAGLFDGILIKDNHIAIAGGITAAVDRARAHAPHSLRIEVEVETLEGLEQALDAGADVVLLDNMDLDTMAAAVRLTAGRALLEASGGISLETVRGVASTGVDIISVGALTHSAPALDLSLEMTTD